MKEVQSLIDNAYPASMTLKLISLNTSKEILKLLAKHDNISVTSIYIKLRMEQSVVSNHLGKLRSIGVVYFKRKGKEKLYFLKHERVQQLNAIIASLDSFTNE